MRALVMLSECHLLLGELAKLGCGSADHSWPRFSPDGQTISPETTQEKYPYPKTNKILRTKPTCAPHIHFTVFVMRIVL